MVLRKFRVLTVSIFKIFAEILYKILKKFSILYYILFIIGLLFSIKNNSVTTEVVLVAIFFLILTSAYCKNYSKIKGFLIELEIKLK